MEPMGKKSVYDLFSEVGIPSFFVVVVFVFLSIRDKSILSDYYAPDILACIISFIFSFILPSIFPILHMKYLSSESLKNLPYMTQIENEIGGILVLMRVT